jgi:3-oxoadipate enol-lactonase
MLKQASRVARIRALQDAAGPENNAMPIASCNGSGTTIASSREMLNRLAEHVELACFDYRGMGLSAPVHQPYGMAAVAADALAVLDQLGWQRAAVCGWSFGGMVAQELAVSYPERLERLALLSTSPGGAIPSFPLDTLADLPPGERTSRALQLMEQRWTPAWLAQHPANGQAIAARVATTRSHTYEGGHAFFLQDPAAWHALVAFLCAEPAKNNGQTP